MPNPVAGALHRDTYLTDVSVAFLQSSTKYVADRVFPRIGSQTISNRIATYDRGDFYRDEVERRMEGAPAAQLGFRTGSTQYVCDEWAAEQVIDDQTEANADAPYSPYEDATRVLVQKMLIKREVEWVTNFFTTGNLWTGSSDGADLIGATDFTRWSNVSSTPIEDVHRQQFRIEAATGFLPNKLVVGRQTWFDLKNHPDIVDRIKYTSSDSVTTETVARLFGLDEVLVASAIRNTAAEGVSHSGSHIAGADDALLVYTPSSPSLRAPASGVTVFWEGLLGSNAGQVIERYRDDRRVSDVVRIRAAWGHARLAPSLGVFFNDCSTNA